MKKSWLFRPRSHSAQLALFLLAGAMAANALLLPTAALLSDTQGVASNTFSTKPDWEVPVTSGAKLLNGIGYADFLRQGDTYQVCASVSDGGNPPATPLTVTANLAVSGNVISAGATSVSLTSGAFACDGVSYNRQSGGNQTADASIPEGSRTFQITATDGASNSATTSWSVTIDNTGPRPTALATSNGGATAGKLEAGDSFTVAVSEGTIDLNRIIAGWSGSSTAVGLKVFNNDAAFDGNDGLAVCHGSTGPTCRADGTGSANILGRVNLGDTTYVTGAPEFDATLAWDPATRVFTATLGACTKTCNKLSTGGSSTGAVLPQDGATLTGGLRDKAGNGVSGTASETSVHF